MPRPSLRTITWRAALGTLLLVASACASPTPAAEAQHVVERLQAYQQAMLHMDHDLAAGFFTVDSQVSHADGPPVRGREAIRAFLKSFAAYKVLDYRLVAEHTEVHGAQAHQSGSFAQQVTLPRGNTVQVSGLFEADWQREADGQWRLARMHTRPPKSP